MKKRILFIASSPLYKEKGSSLRMYATAKILSEKYLIDLVTYSTGKSFSIKNVNVYRTPKFYKPSLTVGKPSLAKVFLDMFIFFKSIKLLFKNKYDIIHCEDFEGAFLGFILSFFFKNKKLVYNLHNKLSDNLFYDNENSKLIPLARYLENKVIKRSDLIILNWDHYSKDKSFKNKNKFLYYDRISIKTKKFSFKEKNYFVYVGNFKKYQGIKEFLQGFREIKTDMKLVLIGNPSKEIIDYVKNDDKLNNKIVFTGSLPIEHANYLIQKSSFTILPRIKGASMKVITYLMQNKIVLAKNTIYNQELIKENYNGFLYSDKENLKEKLNLLLNKKYDKQKIDKGISETKEKILNIWKNQRFLNMYNFKK